MLTQTAALLLTVSAPPGPRTDIHGLAFEIRTIRVEGSTVAITDVNHDGHADIVSAGGRLTVLLGDGVGGFRGVQSVHAGDEPSDLAFADINGDANIDIVIANHNVHYVTILMGDGQGGFQAAEHSPMRVDVDPHPHAIALADMDADGHDDLLIDHSPRGTPAPGLLRSSGGVLVIRGLGDGRFETRGAVLETGGIPYRGFEAVDINADDRPDILTPHGEEVGVLLNTTENDKFSSTRAQPVRATAPFAVRAADFNADGHPDMVVASGEDAAVVQIFFGDGRGGFEAAEGFATRLARGGKNIAIGDLNGDGVADAIVSAYGSDYILLIFGARDELTTAMLPTGFDHPWGLAAGDVNADGVDDLLVVGDGAREGRLYLSVPEQ